MNPPVYHHTDSARLPWILRDQALKPGSNRVGDFPDDFLWATTDPMGDPTASSAVHPAAYRNGEIAMVRFALAADDFMPWAAMKTAHLRWEPRHIAVLEDTALQMGSSPRQIAQWRCRVEPLRADRWLAVEFRTWRNPRWRAVRTDTLARVSGGIGVQSDDIVFCSRQIVEPNRPTSYSCGRIALASAVTT